MSRGSTRRRCTNMTNKVTTRRDRYLFYKKRALWRKYKLRNKRRRGKPASGKRGSMERDTSGLQFMPLKSYPHVVNWTFTNLLDAYPVYKKSGGSKDPPTWTLLGNFNNKPYHNPGHKRQCGVLERRPKKWPRIGSLPRVRQGRGRAPK